MSLTATINEPNQYGSHPSSKEPDMEAKQPNTRTETDIPTRTETETESETETDRRKERKNERHRQIQPHDSSHQAHRGFEIMSLCPFTSSSYG